MPSNMTEYKCPSCGSTLRFTPEEGKLACDSCGNVFEIESVQAFQEAEQTGTEFDWSSYKKEEAVNAAEHVEGTKVYVCQSCGAAIETDLTTAATACPYCGNNVIINEQLEGGIKPNAIIPFKITPKDLPGTIKNFCRGKYLLPKEFFTDNEIGKVQGLYVPFWLFDCHMDGKVMLNATRVRMFRQGEYDCTQTSFFLLEREGEMSFTKVPVDASNRIDDDLMDSIEPYDYSQLVAFDKRYLSGYLADRFDTDPDAELKRADTRINNTAANAFLTTAPMYTGVSMKSNSVRLDKVSVKYVLLPVYLLNCTWQGKKYRYAINGQTGKIVGELPVSNGKKWGIFAGVAAAVFALVFSMLQFVL